MLVSVILTSYNYRQYVGQAVESVLAQTYSNFELIAIDDGSKDQSLEVLRGFRDSRMTVFDQSNLGQAAAWNRGYSLSRGGIILFLDSDDWWETEKISKIVSAHRLLDGDYGLIQHNLTVHQGSETRPYRRVLSSGDCLSEMVATGNISYFVTSSGLAFNRPVLEKIFPLPESLRISPDAYLTRSAILFGRTFSIPQQLGNLRLHGSNAGMTQGQEFHEQLRRKTIFPALNAFYASQGVQYRFKSASPTWWRELWRRFRASLLSPGRRN